MLAFIKKGLNKLNSYSLKKRAICAFLFITIIAILNIVIVQSLLKQSEDIAVVVNVAGKMRLLSQQAGFQFLTHRRAPRINDIDAKTFEQAFEDAYKALLHGGTAFGLELDGVRPHHREHLLNIHKSWVDYVAKLNSFRAEESKYEQQRSLSREDIKEVLESADALLNNIEVLIAELLVSYQAVHQKITYTSYALFIFDLIILLLVYRVFISRIIKPLELLSRQSELIAEGSYGVRTNLQHKDEFGQLSKVLNTSSDHIESLLIDLDKRQKRLTRANEIFEGLASNTVAGIYILDESLNVIYANQHLAKILGCDQSDLENNFVIKNLFSAAEYRKVIAHVNDRLTNQATCSHYETKVTRSDGTSVDIEIFGSIMHTESGALILGLALDISARKADEASLRRAALIYQNSSEGMVVTDKDGFVIDVNSAFEIITGYAASEILGKRLSYISSGRHDEGFYRAMWQSLEQTGSWQGDIYNLRKSGGEFVEHLKINTVYEEDGSVHSRIGLFSDVTERRRKESLVWHQANYDSLTKLPNRLMFQHFLEQVILQSSRDNHVFAVLFLDLDYFKEVNDTYGHDEGDELLRIMADRLKAAVRKTDMVARLGGDEFTIILKNIKTADAIIPLADKIIDSVAQPYKLKSNTANVSASMGIALFPEHGYDSDSLLKNADLAMYAAKGKGRNQYSLFDPEMRIQADARRQLIHEMNLALVENQLQVYYQPIVQLENCTVKKIEALIRWNHPVKGLLKPADFIALAEETGQIHEIGNWVFQQSVNQLVEWRQQLNKSIVVAIKVSPVQLQGDYLEPGNWVNFLLDRDVPAESIMLEITERLYLDLDGNKDALSKLAKFKQAGFIIALDDFGTGYSSLSHLNKFAIDFLKLDRSYTQGLSENSENYSLCQAIIAMAHELDIKVIAKGVGQLEQHNLIKQANCDYGQGYFYNPPLPVDEIKQLIIKDTSK